MQRFRIHLSAEFDAPFPPLESLPEIEAESAMDAIQQYLETPIVEPKVVPKWARAIITLHENGKPRHAEVDAG